MAFEIQLSNLLSMFIRFLDLIIAHQRTISVIASAVVLLALLAAVLFVAVQD